MKITVSVIKADVGGIGGHTLPSDGLLNAIRDTVKNSGKLLIDHYIGYCGDDSHIVMTHTMVLIAKRCISLRGMPSWLELRLPNRKDCMVQDKICLLYTSPSPRD